MNIRHKSTETQRQQEQAERNLWRMVDWRRKYVQRYGRAPVYQAPKPRKKISSTGKGKKPQGESA